MLARSVRSASPGCFAMVMATGIVSMALRQADSALRMPAVLLAIAAAGFAFLAAASALRAAAFPADLRAGLACPGRAFTSFAFAAAASVLGAGLAGDGRRAAAALLATSAVLAWLVLACLIPAAMTARPSGHPVITDVNGSWYLLVVGTQSVAIAAEYAHACGLVRSGPAALAAIAAWSAGAVLYLVVTVLVAVRLLLAGLGPHDANAPYWVAMGAASITVVAAAGIAGIAGSPAASAAWTALTGLAVLFWAFATCLIPLLAAFTAARCARRPARMRYTKELWTIVFPLGMYAVAGMRLGTAAGLPLIHRIGTDAAWPAAAAWALTFTAMIASPAIRRLISRRLFT